MVEHLCSHLQRTGKAVCSGGDDHELLDIYVVIGMLTPVKNVHERHRQQVSLKAAQVAVKG